MQKALQLVWVVLFKMWHPWITLDCELYQKRKFHYLECQLSTSQWSGIIPTWITFLGDSVLSPRYFNTFFDIWIMNLHGLFSLIVKTKKLQLLDLNKLQLLVKDRLTLTNSNWCYVSSLISSVVLRAKKRISQFIIKAANRIFFTLASL